MRLTYLKPLTISIICLLCLGCTWKKNSNQELKKEITLGAEQMTSYLPMLEGKKVGLVVNQTSSIGDTHLVDTLISLGVNVQTLFAPEHGFRGNNANGAKIKDETDPITKLPITSLYGKNRKAKPEHLANIDIVIFDIQDVGARFYTYISTMHYMMEACAENNIQMIILDRPNPIGNYVDGPVLDLEYKSFVGMHPIPIVHGMTVGELAKMIVGEQWINESKKLQMTVIPMKNWSHSTRYDLPIAPSPNLPNSQSIFLYPSLCLFEGTNISIGRGTPAPFQMIGYPDSGYGDFTFTPKSIPGVSDYPKHENKKCFGVDLRTVDITAQMDISFLIKYYELCSDKPAFFNKFFTKLAGTNQLQKQIEKGMSASEIRASWSEDLTKFRALRKPYLLYNDSFE